tara:strand:- start:8864 stop:9316 length:453 start_codon:yes stop_codon:yes gene_type:complete
MVVNNKNYKITYKTENESISVGLDSNIKVKVCSDSSLEIDLGGHIVKKNPYKMNLYFNGSKPKEIYKFKDRLIREVENNNKDIDLNNLLKEWESSTEVIKEVENFQRLGKINFKKHQVFENNRFMFERFIEILLAFSTCYLYYLQGFIDF